MNTASTNPSVVATCAHCGKAYDLASFIALPWPITCTRKGTDTGDAGGGWTLQYRDCTCVKGATFALMRNEKGELET